MPVGFGTATGILQCVALWRSMHCASGRKAAAARDMCGAGGRPQLSNALRRWPCSTMGKRKKSTRKPGAGKPKTPPLGACALGAEYL